VASSDSGAVQIAPKNGFKGISQKGVSSTGDTPFLLLEIATSLEH
jgi:hypothetical protein